MSKATKYRKIPEKVLMAEQDEKETERETQQRRQQFTQKGQSLWQRKICEFKGSKRGEQHLKAHALSTGSDSPLCANYGKPYFGKCIIAPKI